MARPDILEQLARNLETTAGVLREVSARAPEPAQAQPGGNGADGPRLLSANQAAAYVGVSRTHFWRLRRMDGFPAAVQLATKVGTGLHYRRSDLEAWVASLPTQRMA